MTERVPTEKLDVAFFVPNLEGGIGRVTAAIAKSLHASGKDVAVWSAAQSNSEHEEELALLLPVRHLGSGSTYSSLPSLVRALRERTPCVVVSASFQANCALILASFFVRKKPRMIIAEHTSLDVGLPELSFLKRLIWRMLIRALYPRADAHVAVSKGVARALATVSGVPLQHITVIPNPIISDELFVKSQEPVHHPFFASSEPTVLYVGRFSKEKDVATLLKAFAMVRVPSNLLLLADGPERAALEQFVKENKLSNRVSFLGHVKNPYPYFKKSDTLVLSSKREGLPTVLIEALAFGMKVVSTDCKSGPREILRDGAYGTLVPVGDSDALAKAIETSLKNDKERVPESALMQYKVGTATKAYLSLF